MSTQAPDTGLTDTLRGWFEERREAFALEGLQMEFVDRTHTESNAASIDFTTETLMGRALVWNEGFYDFHLLSIESEEYVFHEHHEYFDVPTLVRLLDACADRMRGTADEKPRPP